MSIREAMQQFDVRDWLSERGRVFKSGPTNITMGACPICGKKGGKFYVNASGGERNGRFTAYCCGNIGNIVTLVMKVENIDVGEARDYIEARVNGENTRIIPVVPYAEPDEAPTTVTLPVPAVAAEPSHGINVKGEWKTLLDRGVDDYIIERHGLLTTGAHVHYLGHRREDLDYRLVVPVYANGVLLSWQARDLRGTSPRKYLFPAGDRSSEWFYDLNGFAGDTMLIVEGVFHKWAWDRLGRARGDHALEHVAVASFGKKLTDAQRQLLLAMPHVKNIVLAWDLDAAPEIDKVAHEMAGKKAVYVMPAHASGRDHDELADDELAAMWGTVEPYSTQLAIRMKTSLALRSMAR